MTITPSPHPWLDAISQPCSADTPAGQDIHLTDWYDRIDQAQQEDTDNLSAGHWDSNRPKARWSDVMDLCQQAIKTSSKDLQLVVWYIRACCRHKGLVELAIALDGLTAWLEHWWIDGYPAHELIRPDDNPEDAHAERMAKLVWLDKHLSHAVGTHALIKDDHGSIHWFMWCKSVGDEAIKTRAERYVQQHRRDIKQQLDDLCNAQSALKRIAVAIEKHWGQGASPFSKCSELFTRMIHKHQEWLGYEQSATTLNMPRTAQTMPPSQPEAPENKPATEQVSLNASIQKQPAEPSRAQMIEQLEQVALYFKTHEPYGPLAPMLDKALAWASKPLHVWLTELVKDDATKQKMQDVLGIRLE